jgi:hypothetical protein
MFKKLILVMYQHLFAQICIFELDTIGYKRYNFKMKVDYQGLFKQEYDYRYAPTLI